MLPTFGTSPGPFGLCGAPLQKAGRSCSEPGARHHDPHAAHGAIPGISRQSLPSERSGSGHASGDAQEVHALRGGALRAVEALHTELLAAARESGAQLQIIAGALPGMVGAGARPDHEPTL